MELNIVLKNWGSEPYNGDEEYSTALPSYLRQKSGLGSR